MHRAHRVYGPAEKSDGDLIHEHAALLDRCARSVARRTAGAVTAEDLWSAGALGLLDAARRFDVGRGIRFETFAEHRIRGAMMDELRRLDHLPRRLRAQLDALRKKRVELERAFGRPAEAAELATALEIPLEELAALDGVAAPVLPMEFTTWVASQEEAADETVARRELAQVVSDGLSRLPERLLLVMSLHYVEELTYKEIAQIIGVSEPRVCQLHAEALALLRSTLKTRT